jgi:hypothetical protein
MQIWCKHIDLSDLPSCAVYCVLCSLWLNFGGCMGIRDLSAIPCSGLMSLMCCSLSSVVKHNGMAPIKNYSGIIKSVFRHFQLLQDISWPTDSKLSAAVLKLIYRCCTLNQNDATESCPSEISTLYKSHLVEILVRFEVTDATKTHFSKFTVVFKEKVTLLKLNYKIAKFRLSQRCYWRFKFSVTSYSVMRFRVTDVSIGSQCLHFQGKQFRCLITNNWTSQSPVTC